MQNAPERQTGTISKTHASYFNIMRGQNQAYPIYYVLWKNCVDFWPTIGPI